MSRPHDRAIVGGGFLGMTLALRLARAGERVTLYEAAPELGGLASTWQLGDVTWDRHYHVTLLSDSHLRALLADIGLDSEMDWVETKTGCFANGELYSISNTIEFLRFPPLRLVDKIRLGATVFWASRIRNWKPLEGITVEQWLTRWPGRRAYQLFWLPLLRAKLGENHRRASAAFIWAVMQRLYAARRTGLKKEMFGYVRGGYARILERLGEDLEDAGVTVRLGQRVDEVSVSDGTITVRAGDREHNHEAAVVTAAAPIAARLVPQLSSEERRALDDIAYQGIVCASVLLEQPLAEFYVTNITDDGLPFTGVIEMSSLVDRSYFGGRNLIFLPRYVDSDDPYLDAPLEEIESSFLEGLERMYPSFDRSDVAAFRVSRVRYVLPIPTLGYSDRLPSVTTSLPGIHVVSSAHIVNGTLNVNETVDLANRTADILLAGSAASAVATRGA